MVTFISSSFVSYTARQSRALQYSDCSGGFPFSSIDAIDGTGNLNFIYQP
jgi:hypothetical protein